MAGKEAAEGSRARRRMDLNLHVGLPPLPPPRVWLNTSAPSLALMPNSTGTASEAPRTGEPEGSPDPVAAHSPPSALFVLEDYLMHDDPIVYSRFGGYGASSEEYTDAPEASLPAPVPVPVEGPSVTGPHLVVAATGLEGDDLLVTRSVRPRRAAVAAGGIEMVNTSALRLSTQGAATTGIDAGAPELRLLRVIQISQQHNIVSPRSAILSQGAANTDADSLVRAIQHTHSSIEAARGKNPVGIGNKVCGSSAARGDRSCDCNSSFDCNICLEVARQPMVTPCGHLFCWPCLYQWLYAQYPFSECPICKGEVLKGDVTPIYGRGDEEESTAKPNLPPRPRANRRENMRQQLEMAQGAREKGRVLRQMNKNQIQGWFPTGLPIPAGVQMTSVPAAWQRAGAPRQDAASRSIHPGVLNVGNVASESSNQNQLPHSNGNNAAQVVHAAHQQSPSVEQLSTSSTIAAVVGEPGSSRRSRPSESPAIRRTRRRPQ